MCDLYAVHLYISLSKNLEQPLYFKLFRRNFPNQFQMFRKLCSTKYMYIKCWQKFRSSPCHSLVQSTTQCRVKMTSSHPTPSSPFLSRSPRLSNRGGSFVTVDLGKYTRIASLELLNPSFHSKARLTDFRTAAFNLVATIVGGGVLSLPYVFYRVGIFTGLALLILAAIITEFSLYILCSCARRTGGRTYMEIVGHCFGPVSEIFTSVLLVALCGMMMVGYMVLIMGIFTPVVREFFTTSALVELSGEKLEMNILTISLLMVSPFLFKRDLYSLRHVCYIGFCSVCYLAIVISYRYVELNISD